MSTTLPDKIKFRGAHYIKVAAAKPFFQHDCHDCKYLGSAMKPDGRRGDFYIDEGEETGIIRWGNRGEEYLSMRLRNLKLIPTDDQTWGVWRFFYEMFGK